MEWRGLFEYETVNVSVWNFHDNAVWEPWVMCLLNFLLDKKTASNVSMQSKYLILLTLFTQARWVNAYRTIRNSAANEKNVNQWRCNTFLLPVGRSKWRFLASVASAVMSDRDVGLPIKFSLLEKSLSTDFLADFPNFIDGLVRGEPGGFVHGPAYASTCDKYRNFSIRTDDVWIVTFPKCGKTDWRC